MAGDAFLCRWRGREAQVEVALLGREFAQAARGHRVTGGDQGRALAKWKYGMALRQTAGNAGPKASALQQHAEAAGVAGLGSARDMRLSIPKKHAAAAARSDQRFEISGERTCFAACSV